MFVVCEEHLDVAIDTFVVEYEEAPDIVDLERVKFAAWQPPAHCEHCAGPAKYLVI